MMRYAEWFIDEDALDRRGTSKMHTKKKLCGKPKMKRSESRYDDNIKKYILKQCGPRVWMRVF
jgi:hypothetical protein